MTDLLERPPVQDVLLDERKLEPKVEPTVEPPREEPPIEVPTAKRPVRWIRWMIAALVLAVGATVMVFALSGDGTTAVLDTDGSFQAVETERMTALAPTGVDLDGSFQAVETQLMESLKPATVTVSPSCPIPVRAGSPARFEPNRPQRIPRRSSQGCPLQPGNPTGGG